MTLFPTYSNRKSVFQGERTYSFDSSGLLWQEAKGNQGGVVFSEIRSVELTFTPTRPQRNL